MFVAAMTLLSLTSATVRTITLEILLDRLNEARRDFRQYLHHVRGSLTTEFTRLQSEIRRKGGVRKLCIRWGNLRRSIQLGKAAEEQLCSIARFQLSELDADQILHFASIGDQGT